MDTISSPGEYKEFNYTGSIQTITLDPGSYKLEVWGAQGANRNNSGGLGGYSSGEIDIPLTTTLYICVGGQGSGTSGGYNGGGNTGGAAGGGGGATHIAKEYGLLSSLYNYKDDGETILIVAGGGGGAQAMPGGAGGGINGSEGGQKYGTRGYGGSQTAGGGGGGYAGSFGQGGNGATGGDRNYGGAGGGGWYGGGGASSDGSVVDDSGGGGGSGFIGNVRDGVTNNGVRSGSGYAKITCLTIFNINDLNSELITIGSSKSFGCTCKPQVIALNPGKYKLECWGAQGGSMESGYTGKGGLGGYSSGVLTLIEKTILFVYVGQQGQGYNSSRSTHYGGWNGGGYCYGGASGGGGASDIRINSASRYARVIVAGGGGGSNDSQDGGAGGGIQGGTGVNGSATNGEGGSQIAGGRGWIQGNFGQGAGASYDYSDGGAGGGGWYGGGKANGASVAGGGGSGYVYDASNAKNYPSGCLLNSKYYLQYGKNIRGDHTFYAPNGNLENGHSGDGYIRITNIGDNFQVEFYYTETLEPIILTPGRYKFEAYGALGGMYTSGYERQQGGYTSGIVDIKRTMTIYAACGRRGLDYSENQSYGMQFNGGGEGYSGGGDGGGATDFRLIDGTWNDVESLKSRIFVSGGAGGSDSNSCGGIGGGLIGESCQYPQSGSVATGGTQTSGGVQPSNTAVNGRFGMGGGATFSSGNDAGGGGGGYYGGAAGTGGHAAGGGGSSFAAGWSECDTTYDAYHFNLKFTDVVLNRGGGIGDGVARITKIKDLPQSVYKIDFTFSNLKGIENTFINHYIENTIIQGDTQKFLLLTGEHNSFNQNTTVYFDINDTPTLELDTHVMPGYTFQKYSGYNTCINAVSNVVLPNQDIQINIEITPNTDTRYTVRHRLMNLDGSTYRDVAQQILKGTTDTTVTPNTRTYEGFTSPAVQTINVNGNGSSIVIYSYTRNKYTVTTVKDVGCITISPSVTVFYGEEVSLSITLKPGYDFIRWDGENLIYKASFTFTMPAHNVTYNAITSPWSGIPYKVLHKKMNLDGKTYTLEKTENFYGKTDQEISPTTKTYTGFTSPPVQSTTIVWDGSRIIEYLYTRNKYKVNLSGDVGCGSFIPGVSTDIFYQQSVDINVNIRPGYNFVRWTGNAVKYTTNFTINMPAYDVSYYAYTNPRNDIPYKVKHEKMNTTGTGYDVFEEENFKGTVDTNISPAIKTYIGFTSPSVQTVNLEGDGSTVIIYLYTRHQFNLTLNRDSHIDSVLPFESGKIYYEQVITITANPHIGYAFKDWTGYDTLQTASFQFTMPLENVTFDGHTIPRDDTLYTVKHQKKDFDTEQYVPFEIEEFRGTSDTLVTPLVKTIQGLISPAIQTVNIECDGSRIVIYNYERLSYSLYVQDGTAPKHTYYFEERVNLTHAKQSETHPQFKSWLAQEDSVKFQNAYRKETFFLMPPCDVHVYVDYEEALFRKNSNIYKNIFYAAIFDVENLEEVISRIPATDEQFYQENHGFSVGDVLQFDQANNKYILACADTPEHSHVDGVVSEVRTEHIFTVLSIGKFKYHVFDNFTDTSILYLSDTIPGRMCHYQEITNTVYIPVGITCNDEVVINIMNGVMGMPLAPYREYQEFEVTDLYTQQEIEDTIAQIWSNVR